MASYSSSASLFRSSLALSVIEAWRQLGDSCETAGDSWNLRPSNIATVCIKQSQKVLNNLMLQAESVISWSQNQENTVILKNVISEKVLYCKRISNTPNQSLQMSQIFYFYMFYLSSTTISPDLLYILWYHRRQPAHILPHHRRKKHARTSSNPRFTSSSAVDKSPHRWCSKSKRIIRNAKETDVSIPRDRCWLAISHDEHISDLSQKNRMNSNIPILILL